MRCKVIGPQRVLERRRGEVVYLDEAQAARLIAAGHVEPAPAPPPRTPPPRKRSRKPGEPRPTAGLSHVPDTADMAEDNKE